MMAYTREEYDDERAKGELPNQPEPRLKYEWVPRRHHADCTCGYCRPEPRNAGDTT